MLFSSTTNAQVAINSTGALPDNSAVLDVQSSSRGMLIPRMTTAQIAAIPNPSNGLIVFDSKKGLSIFSTGKGWGRLEPNPSGRIYVSEIYPDTLYPSAEYDYLGVFFQQNAFKKNYGILQGGWFTKKNYFTNVSFQNAFCYSGSVSNKIFEIGSTYNGFPNDSSILVYNLPNDAIYLETLGYIKRSNSFTATMDTTNARVFIWGGEQDFENPWSTPYERGYMYYYNTGSKVLMDSVTMPFKRNGHSAIWATSVNKLLVFGGSAFGPSSSPGLTNTMYAYNPATNTWAALATSPLSARRDHVALYDGNDRMIVWGGNNGSGTEYYNGAVYTISTNTWSLISATNAPARKMSNGSWTGTEMLLSSPNLNVNAYDYLAYRYNLVANTWTAIPAIPSYLGKTSVVINDHLWSGSNMLQIAYLIPYTGSPTNVMWSYSPGTNTWTGLAGPPLGPSGIAKGIQAGDTTFFVNYSVNAFYKYLPSVAGSPSYQVQDQEFHYYKKK